MFFVSFLSKDGYANDFTTSCPSCGQYANDMQKNSTMHRYA